MDKEYDTENLRGAKTVAPQMGQDAVALNYDRNVLRPLTFGEQEVGPMTGDEEVDAVKKQYADVIDHLNILRRKYYSDGINDAIKQTVSACMWAARSLMQQKRDRRY